MKLHVRTDYHSNLGAFQAGATIEVEDALARRLLADSPGTFEVAKAPTRPPQDRMVGRAGTSQKSLDGLTHRELYELAQAQDIEGRSDMTKDELIAALRG